MKSSMFFKARLFTGFCGLRGVVLLVILLVAQLNGFTQTTIYVDPTNSATGQNGTISNPYDSWTDVSLVNGNTYLQKRGTTYTSSTGILISSKTNVIIGSYGSGNLPIFSYTGSGYAFRVNVSNNCTIEDFEVNGNVGAHSLIYFSGTAASYSQNNKVQNCIFYNAHNTNNAGFGVYAWYNNNLKLLNVEIHNIALDGMFIQDNTNIEIGYCNVYDINRRYFLNSNETYSSGDGIQLVGYYNGFHIHHTTIDRTNGALNKYSLILNSAPGKSDNATGILEFNTFINSAGIYSAILIERGNNIITRYNTFKGASRGLRLGGVYTKNNLIHNNIFYNSTFGVVIGYSYSGTGVPSYGPCIGTKVYNNVFYNTGRHVSIDQTSVEARNNIHYRTNTTDVALYNYGGGSWTLSNNCYSDAAAAGTPGTGSSPVIGNPLFISPSTGNFNIQSNSPCINKGTNVGVPLDYAGTAIFQGTAPEIGIYEFLNSSGSNLPPVINNQSFSVNENAVNGTVVGTVVANDPNTGQTLSYSITGGNTNNAFTINSSTGIISVANSQALNYETTTSFSLTVRATDNGSPVLYAQSTVTITITPSQGGNLPPVMANQSFSVVQNAPAGFIVGTVVATDPNAGQSLTYSITGGNVYTYFVINASTGVISVYYYANLNPMTFNLTVRATDNGSPSLYAQSTVTITVTPSQGGNLPPVMANQSFSVAQNAPAGFIVGTVVATDPNAGQTLTYSITGGNLYTYFVINASTGVISVYYYANLNPMTFNLTVRATDNGSPALYAQSTVTITVTPSQGGNLPPVMANQSFSVAQNAPAGFIVGTVVATDPNAGQTITYSITGGNVYTYFIINASTGVISVYYYANINPMTFNLTVRATDNGSPSLYAQSTVTITVTPSQGGNLPPVMANQSFSVAQNAPAGFIVGTVVATDPNAGQTITYSITGGNVYTYFLINASTGVISVYYYANINPMTFNLTVRATDNGSPVLYSESTMTITVTASQGNLPPVIANQTFSVVQNAPAGYIVGTVVATDPNAGQTLTYSITGGNVYTYFLINASTGIISVYYYANLNPMTFNLTVRATDNGSPVLYSQATVTITVVQGSYMPQFHAQEFVLSDELLSGILVGKVTLSDQTENQTLNYSFPDKFFESGFAISPTTGEITIDNPVDISTGINQIRLLVTDTNNQLPDIEGTITITVAEKTKTENITASTQEPQVEIEAVLYPNPSQNGIFRLKFTDNQSNSNIEVYDLTGRMVASIISDSSNDILIDLSSQPKGTYIIKVQKGGKWKTLKALIS